MDLKMLSGLFLSCWGIQYKKLKAIITITSTLISFINANLKALFSMRNLANGIAVKASIATIIENIFMYSLCPEYSRILAMPSAFTNMITTNITDVVNKESVEVL